jgi:aryl carrier-like protein
MTQDTEVLTKDQMRADIAAQIGVAPEEVEAEESLVDQGLDSMQVMTLLMHWGETIKNLNFTHPTKTKTPNNQ